MAERDRVYVCRGGGLFGGPWRPLLSPTDLWRGPGERRVAVSLSASDRPHSEHSCAGPCCCFLNACWAAALLRGRPSLPLAPRCLFTTPSLSLSCPFLRSSSSFTLIFVLIRNHSNYFIFLDPRTWEYRWGDLSCHGAGKVAVGVAVTTPCSYPGVGDRPVTRGMLLIPQTVLCTRLLVQGHVRAQ